MPHRLPIVLIPVLELVTFLCVADFVGFWTALGLIALSALLGAVLLRAVGIAVIRRTQHHLQQGTFTPAGLVNSVWVVVASFLFIVPGFLTSAAALALAIPAVRRGLGLWVLTKWVQRAHRFSATSMGRPTTAPEYTAPMPPPHQAGPPRDSGPIIDAEFEDLPPLGRRSFTNPPLP